MAWRVLMAAAVLAVFLTPLAAFDEDDLFSGDFFFDDMIEDVEEAKDTHLELLVSDDIEIGGKFSASLEGILVWTDGSTAYSDAMDAGGHVFLDARPKETFRVFTKAKLDLSASKQQQSPVSLYEYFADISWKDRLFIRAGKQVVSWRAAPIWNPADILSLKEEGLSEYEQEHEGPLAFKASMPAGGHAMDLFVVSYEQGVKVVPRAVLHLPPAEVIAGIGYRYGYPVEGALSARVMLGDVTVFGEGLVYLDCPSSQNQGTVGLSWVDQERDVTAAAQYYYHGDHESALYIASRLVSDDLHGIVYWTHKWDAHKGSVSMDISYSLFDGIDLTSGAVFSYGSIGPPVQAAVGVRASGRF